MSCDERLPGDFYVIRCGGFSNGTDCPIYDQYVMTFDHDAFDGTGHGIFTSDPQLAMRFDTAAEALDFYRKQSTVRPLRADGQPNCPMRFMHASIDNFSCHSKTVH